jgi:TPR repeat protein
MRFLAPITLAVVVSTMPAFADDAAALRVLGFKYYDGKGVKQDTQRAVALFEQAGELGDVESQSNLALMYEMGLSVAQDDAKSAYWATKAAERGDRASQFRLAVLLYQGRGITQDRVEAAKWWRIATLPGDDWALRLRPSVDSAEGKMTSEQLTQAQQRVDDWVKSHPTPR